MTHTLHRRGTIHPLEDDYVVLMMPSRDINDKGSGEKLQRIFQIARTYDIVNAGDVRTGSIYKREPEEILNNLSDGSILHVVFEREDELRRFLAELKKENLGLSVVVSGLFGRVHACLDEISLSPHTVQYSLGSFGRTELLPPEEILEVTTMCGHHMVSPNLVKKVVSSISEGTMTSEEGARILAKQCLCGVFNLCRARRLLRSLAGFKP